MPAPVFRRTSIVIVAAIFSMGANARSTMLPTFAGPYIAYSDRFYPCKLKNGQDPTDHVVIRHTHFNPARPYDKQLLSGYVNGSADLDDTWGAVADMAVRSNNQWKEHAFIFNFPAMACSSLRANIPGFFRILFKAAGDEALNMKTKCVIPAGTYLFDKEPIDWVFPNFPVMPYGHYRFTLRSGPKGGADPTYCVRTECHVIPKP